MHRTATKQKRSCYEYGWLLLVALLVAGLSVPTQAESLSSRLSRLVRGKEQVQRQLRGIKQKQRSASAQLYQAQKRLDIVQSRLADARRQLEQTRGELREIRADLNRLEERLAQHEQDVGQHLLALYRLGNTSYLEVVMQADSFADFANRQHFIHALVNQDQYLLDRLAWRRRECQEKRAELEKKQALRERLARQVGEDEAEAKQRRDEVHAILASVNQSRAAAEAMLAAQEAEERELLALIGSRSGSRSYSGSWSGSLLRPVSGPITSPFGMRVHPITGRYKLHTGVDIGAPTGTPIGAADKGLVIYTGWKKAYGKTVLIDHGSGVVTWYAHCSSILVHEGQLVTRGQTIARVGNTGWSTGPHLHFGVSQNGKWRNPQSFKWR